METLAPPSDADPIPDRIQIRVRRTLQDRIFRAVVRSAGGLTLAIMALIAYFLVVRSSQAFRVDGLSKFLTKQAWSPNNGNFGIGALLFDTVVIALIAIVIAVPASIAVALFITEYAPARVRRVLVSLIDLLAAVPSIVYALWGLFFLVPRQRKVSLWLTTHLGFIPIFKTAHDGRYTGSAFIAGTVVAIMTIPICTAVMREVFSQAPPGEREGVLALGGTRWGMIRTVVLPFGRGGIIGATMLGLGRALGETIVVAFVISSSFRRSFEILHQGGNSIAANIANTYGNASPGLGISALFASGLALFALTLIVNTLAATIVARSQSGASTEI
jgi:phosphate transport system permease protein